VSKIDYQVLREKAEKATWGDWDSYKPHRGARGYEVRLSSQAIAQHVLKNNAEFIAAFNPKVALSLLDEREAQNKRIAELEACRAALAAENAELKAICDDRRRFIMNGVQMGYIKVPTAETEPDLETIRIAISPQKPIPATDAFLTEVRAQGVEMFAECAYTLEHHDHAVAFAAELRKGDNQ